MRLFPFFQYTIIVATLVLLAGHNLAALFVEFQFAAFLGFLFFLLVALFFAFFFSSCGAAMTFCSEKILSKSFSSSLISSAGATVPAISSTTGAASSATGFGLERGCFNDLFHRGFA